MRALDPALPASGWPSEIASDRLRQDPSSSRKSEELLHGTSANRLILHHAASASHWETRIAKGEEHRALRFLRHHDMLNRSPLDGNL